VLAGDGRIDDRDRIGWIPAQSGDFIRQGDN
jgi:hypothetical protein